MGNTAPNGETIWRCDYEHKRAQDKFGIPIYEQIKEDEAMTVNELFNEIVDAHGFPLEVATDAILFACVINDDHPITATTIQNENGSFKNVPGYFWGDETP
eukprot:6895524-Prymnesium_polylepis.1